MKNINKEKIISENEIEIQSLKIQLRISKEENSSFDYLNKHLTEENKRLEDTLKSKTTNIKNDLEKIKNKKKEYEIIEKNLKTLEMENKQLSETKNQCKAKYVYLEMENNKLVRENTKYKDMNGSLVKKLGKWEGVEQYLKDSYSKFSETFPTTFNEKFDKETKKKLKTSMINYYEGNSSNFFDP